jgi:kumamolisin
MSLRRLLSYAAVMLASMSPAIADPGDLFDGAQSIPSRQGRTIVIPASSLAWPDDQGVRATTNVRFIIPAPTVAQKPAVSGPPFSGYNFETPASLVCIYNIHNLNFGQQAPGCNPNTVTLPVATGGSNAIALVDAYHYPAAMADLTTYSKQFGLPVPTASSFQTVFASGRQPARNLGWELEEALDIQMAHAMAPNAKIYLVEAASNLLSDLLIAVDKGAQLVAAAGGGEVSMSWGSCEFSSEATYDSHFQKNGVVFFASTGDSPGVSWPSVSANVVAVGGTSLARQLTTFAFLYHASWSDAGGGNSSYVSLPNYQSSISGLVGTMRGVPDIAAVADPNTGVWVYDSGNGGWYIVGGTSVSSPLIAGIVNSSGHFYASSAAELAQIYGAGTFAAATTGYCGPQAAFQIGTSWNFCVGVGSPQTLTSQ